MACYIGITETTPSMAPFTHSLVTPWDSISGQSPLAELCRRVNDRLSALHQAQRSFTRIGSASDTAFADYDYEGNPDKNPAGDFKTVLEECYNAVYAMTEPPGFGTFGGMVNSSGFRWKYNNASTVRATLLSAMSGLLFTLQEDWKPIIIALRAALTSLSGATITSQSWTHVSASFGTTTLHFGDPGYFGPGTGVGKTGITFHSYGFDPATVTGTTTKTAGVVSPENDWPISGGVYGGLPGGDQDEFIAGFDVGDGAAIPTPPTVTTDVVVTSPTVGSGGWYKFPETMTKTWRVAGNPAWNSLLQNAMIGKSLRFTIQKYGNNPGMPLEIIPNTGIVTFNSLSEIILGKLISVNIGLPDSVIPDGSKALAWEGNNNASSPYGTVGPKSCHTDIVLSENTHEFCIDSNGVYHDG